MLWRSTSLQKREQMRWSNCDILLLSFVARPENESNGEHGNVLVHTGICNPPTEAIAPKTPLYALMVFYKLVK